MNNSTTPRHWALGVLVFCALTLIGSKAVAQCTLQPFPLYAPVPTFNLPLDAVFPGEADLNGNVLLGYFNSDCAFNGPNGIIRIYDSPDPMIDPTGVSSEVFTCAQIGQTFNRWVTIEGIIPVQAESTPRKQIIVTIVDNIAPTIVVPTGTISRNADAGTAGTCRYTISLIEFNPTTANDNCSSTFLEYRIDGGIWTSGSTLAGVTLNGVGPHTIQWRITDGALPTANVTTAAAFTVNVTDITPPSISCPGNQTINTNPSTGCTAVASGIAATFSDNCAVTKLTWSASGATTASSPATGINDASSTIFNKGVTTIVYTAADANANSSTCSFTVTVNDNVAPALVGTPANITVGTTGNLCTGSASWTNPTITDNCAGPYTLSMQIGAGPVATVIVGASSTSSAFNLGSTTITYVATDNSGRTSVSSFTVTVQDNVAPVVAGPLPQTFTVSVNSSTCDKVISWMRPSIGSPVDCGPVTMSETFVMGPDNTVLNGLAAFNPATGGGMATTNFPSGTTKIRYSWIDNSPNSPDFSVDYTFNVTEDIAPTAKCKNVTLSLDANGNALLTPALADFNSTDNCPLGLTYTLECSTAFPTSSTTAIAFDCGDLAMQPVNGWPYSLIVRDANNNSNTANCNVTILDVLAPVVICPANITVNTGVSDCEAGIASAGDLKFNVLPLALIAGEYDGNCDVVKITATANNGADLDPMTINPQASVNFTGPNPSAILSGAKFQKGTTNVVYTCSDQSNNAATCAFTVTVLDNVRPEATGGCPPNISRPINTLSCSYIPSGPIWNVIWTDNCTANPVISVTGGSPNNPYPQGETQITITATDESGNIGTCAFVVDVFDPVKPVAVCKNKIVQLSTAPTNVFATDINDGSSDNCTLIGPSNLSFAGSLPGVPITISSSTCNDIPVTLVVTDRDGNTATCTALIDVQDNVAPVCTTQNLVRFLSPTNPGSVLVNAAEFNLSSSDNCTSSNALVFEISSATGTPAGFNSALTFDCTPLGVNTVTFRTKDTLVGGNTSINCTATLTIRDNTRPVVTSTPPNINVSCNLVVPTIDAYLATLPSPTFADNCSIKEVTSTKTVTPGSCNYTILRSWIAEDFAGNTVQAVQTINVSDVTGPNITVPNDNVIIKLSMVPTCFPNGSYPATVVDNCSTVTTNWKITYASGLPATEMGPGTTAISTFGFKTGENTITFTATDACGNSSIKTITVTVVDDEKPLFVNYLLPNPNPNNTSYCGYFVEFNNAPGICGYTFQWVRPWNGKIDECNGFTFSSESIKANGQDISANFPWDPSNNLTQFIPVSITLPVGTTVFKYVVKDNSQNTDSCKFTVKVRDTQAPVLIGTQTALLTSICPTQPIPDYTGLVSVIDNCPSGNTLTQVPAPSPGTTLSNITYITPGPNPVDGSQFVVTITAFDGTNFSAPRNITVTLDDNTAPIPIQNTLLPAESNCGFIILPTPTAQPNCANGAIIYGTPGGVNATPVITNGITTGYRVNLVGSTCQTYFVTWSYNDGNGNVSTQLQEVKICPDVAPPVAKCKNTVTNINLSPFNATITPEMIDADNGSFSINGSHDPDNCSAVPTPKKVTLSLSQKDYTCADLSKTTVTLTATDNGGNTASCTASIKVIDVNAPMITGTLPANVTIEACVDSIPALPALPAVLDNCSATVTVVENTTQTTTGSGKYNYVITRTWTATDTYGNTTTASRTITVRDTKKPEFTAPAPSSLLFNTDPADADCAQTTILNLAPLVKDCAPDNELVITSNPAYFSLNQPQIDTTETLPVGSHVVTFTATDPSGNSASFSVTIVVSDITPPIASCINGISVALNPNGQAIVTPSLVNNSSFDNCTSVPVSLQVQELDEANGDPIGNPSNQLLFDCMDADGDTKYPLILLVKDAVGNSSFCETYVVIQDNVTPTITCPTNKTVNCSTTPNTAFATSVLGNATATDNCPITAGSITFVDVPVSNGYSCNSFVRTFRATDLSGNSSTCSQTITVQDLEKPKFTIEPQSATISCSNPLVDVPDVKATDNCTPANEIVIVFTRVKTDSIGACGKYEYKETRTWKATDKCGNTAVHTQILQVEDNADPVFVGMPDSIVYSSANFPANTDCTVPVSFDVAQYLSDCQNDADILVTNNAPHGNLSTDISGNYDVGTYLVYFSAIDACGNVGLDTVKVIVRDNSVPTVICNNNVVISLGTNGEASIQPEDIDLGSTDNCGIASRLLSKSDFDCSELGANSIQLIVKDIHGNTNSCTVNVQVTLGVNTGFNVTATSTNETSFGANNGTASVTVTGGTGSFTYLWNTTASTPTITNLIPGTYSVTITDQNTGCVSKATVTVNEGPSLILSAGTASGCQGAVVSIPVTVGNLVNSTGFSFTMNLTNSNVGKFTGISNVNPALIGLISNVLSGGNALGVFWPNAGAPLNLPNNAVLFNVTIMMGNAAIGTASSLNFASTPIPLEFNIDNNGNNVILDINDIDINNGSIAINCIVNDFDITGKIETWRAPVKPVPNATVALTGGIPNSVVTPANGTYAFTVPASNNTILTPTKITNGNDGITAADLLFISNHIFGNLLVSPYQWVAADVNGDGNITLNDYLRIQQVALGSAQHIAGSPDWKFIPKLYTFPTPNPLNPNNYPQSVTFIANADANVDFVAVRMGDVNGNITPSVNNNETEDRTDGNFNFRVEDKGFTAGQIVEVPFRASDFRQREAYQMTIGFDPTVMELENIEMGALPNLTLENFGTSHLVDGNLTTVWVSKDPVTIADDKVLFTLRFRTLRSAAALSDVLHAGSEVIRAEAYNIEGQVMKVDLEFIKPANGQDLTPFALYQNQPNPFAAETRIGFRLPESGRAVVRVYSMSGQLVKTVVGSFDKGYNELNFRKDELGQPGVYWYELETSTHSDRKKMILMD